MPSSSISISPTPLSCTIFTSSRIRSPRSASASSAISDVSREWRARILRRSSSASVAEHRDQHELLLARGEALGLLAHVLRRHRILGELRARREQLDGALDRRVDRLRRLAVAALDELAELVDHGAVAARLEHVQERLRREDLPDRRGERRPAGLGAHAADLLEHLEQAIGRGVRAKVHVERRDETGRKVVLGRAHGDPRRDRRDRLVPDPLVDHVRGLPELRRGRDPVAWPRPSSDSASDSPETRWSVSASG